MNARFVPAAVPIGTFGEITIDGTRFAVMAQLEVDCGRDEIAITTTPPTLRMEQQCEHCGRGDLLKVTARSWSEAVELGWLVEIGPA